LFLVTICKEFFISVKLDPEAVGDIIGQLAVLRYLAEARRKMYLPDTEKTRNTNKWNKLFSDH